MMACLALNRSDTCLERQLVHMYADGHKPY